MNLFTKQTHKTQEQTCDGRGVGEEGRACLGVWGGRCKLLHLEYINNKVLLGNTGNYVQYPVINHNG